MTEGFDACFAADAWERLIRESPGSPEMKARVIAAINELVRKPGSPFLSCFRTGFVLGEMSRHFKGEQLRDFERTIEGTRDLNKLPVVRRSGQAAH